MRAALLLCALCAAILPAAAQASTARVVSTDMIEFSGGDAPNRLEMSGGSTAVTFQDPAEPITPLEGCEALADGSVRCQPQLPPTEVHVSLGTGDDAVVLQSVISVTVDGGAGDDSLDARMSQGATELDGGPGRDRLEGDGSRATFFDRDAPEYDSFTGGSLVYERDTAVTVYLRVLRESGVGGAEGDEDDINQMLSVTGGRGPDTLIDRGYDGGPRNFAPALRGGGGDDRLQGSGDHNTLDGGAGSDRLFAGGGGDILEAGAGDDLLRGGPGNDLLAPHDETERRRSVRDRDRMFGEAGRDSMGYSNVWTAEHASCGPGQDTFEDPEPPPAPPLARLPRNCEEFGLVRIHPSLRRGVATFTLTVPPSCEDFGGRCVHTVLVRRHRTRRPGERLGRTSLETPARAEGQLRIQVRLSAKARSALARQGRLAITVRVNSRRRGARRRGEARLPPTAWSLVLGR
jgi:hypothetical protein